MGEQVTALLMEPGPARDRLTAGIYLPNDPEDRLGRLEAALTAVIAAEPVEKKLRAAVHHRWISPESYVQFIDDAVTRGVISHAEAGLIRDAETRRHDALRVDDFSPEEWAAQRR
ncbi:MAG: DUF1974 domain-containing protein [Nitrospirae bacterium]|nr:DUF1974 domain-containing protein [Nitrospirota bacterium]